MLKTLRVRDRTCSFVEALTLGEIRRGDTKKEQVGRARCMVNSGLMRKRQYHRPIRHVAGAYVASLVQRVNHGAATSDRLHPKEGATMGDVVGGADE